MKSKKNTFVSRAAVGCVTTAIFLLLCIIKGIYPFGIATLDTVDFQSQWIPAYYHVWDVLHGDGSAFFDWRVGGGNNFAGDNQIYLKSDLDVLEEPKGIIKKTFMIKDFKVTWK